jgi:hypothetical protein
MQGMPTRRMSPCVPEWKIDAIMSIVPHVLPI